MTTAQFIAKTYNTPSDRERRCSSVFTDYSGNVYSYGYHYPLAFNIGGLDFINVTGYSNTTAKHIGWAWSAVGYDAIAVELPSRSGWNGSIDYTLEDMRRALLKQHTRVTDQMLAKKRKDTQVYRSLQDQASRIVGYLKQVTEAM